MSHPDIETVVNFWFYNTDQKYSMEYTSDCERLCTKRQIVELFLPLLEQARDTSDLDHWSATPLGSLALILLMVQFPGEVCSGLASKYASLDKAVEVAVRAIARGFDQSPSLTLDQQSVLYSPLVCDESLVSQVFVLGLFEGLAYRRCEPGSAEQEQFRNRLPSLHNHIDVIVRFGRFPNRNAILSRESTPEELDFLKEHPGGMF